ncbi:hypothetical protein BSL78_18727 [Apostichopus japonicus]|uniref:BEN domain-containing protein n=1 Tax=Stichopus japonicus TaxID=307972 RepID=A0A2G8K8W0_STIJA|nr:hypothetical protein BSL78_18727 [Apostichopus japonicus]
MAEIGVRWLEPERDVGKRTFVKLTDLICDRSKDLPSGTVVKAKWRSTGRVYKATLLNNLIAKINRKQSSSQRQPAVLRTPNESKPDSDDDMPLAYQSVTAEKVQHECPHVKELKDKIVMLEETVASMATELKAMRKDNQELKNTLSEVNTNNTQQFLTILEAITQSHDTARETQNLMKSRVAAEEKAQEEQRNLLNNNGKRIQPAFGLVENGLVTCHKNGRKLISVEREIYRRMFDDSKTGTSFLRKLMKCTFSEEELAESNFSGGSVISAIGTTVKKCLDRDRIMAILGQVELEFPNSTKAANFTRMRDAINQECRRVVQHVRQDAV